jgi:hypothetical protein
MPTYRPLKVCFCLLLFALLAAPVAVEAAEGDELDNAKWKLQLNGWVSSPTGYFNGKNNQGYFDLQRDLGFGNYVTFAGKMDWRFKRKHHLFFVATPIVSSKTTTLTRTIEWQGQTFNVGAQVDSSIKSLIFTPGYQYDFFRFRQIWLGVLVNVNLAYTSASLKTNGNISGGGGSVSGSTSVSGSVFAPLPAIGPTFRWYPVSNSNRLYLDGTLTGMSFFGYGNFVSGNAALGIPLSHHWDARAGYLMGSRLKIEGSSNQIAIRLTQKGPVFGVEYHWGTR